MIRANANLTGTRRVFLAPPPILPGTRWVNVIGGDLNTARSDLGAFGTSSAGVATGGSDSLTSIIVSTEKFVP